MKKRDTLTETFLKTLDREELIELGRVDGESRQPTRCHDEQYLEGYHTGYEEALDAAREQRDEWDAQDKLEREF